MSFKQIIFNIKEMFFFNRYFFDDYKPKRCIYCESSSLNEEIVDKIDGLLVEKQIKCSKCNEIVGYWSYGYWLP